jgi:hypothetical protein
MVSVMNFAGYTKLTVIEFLDKTEVERPLTQIHVVVKQADGKLGLELVEFLGGGPWGCAILGYGKVRWRGILSAASLIYTKENAA